MDPMKISLCNEVLADLSLERQCEVAAALGYDGLEVAPFTLAEAPERITSAEAARIRRTIESFGLQVTGLHWLLVKPAGLSLTDPDAALRDRTLGRDASSDRVVRRARRLGSGPRVAEAAPGRAGRCARGGAASACRRPFARLPKSPARTA